MKLYFSENRLRMVGKAWEIQAKLKELKQLTIPLQDYLKSKGH